MIKNIPKIITTLGITILMNGCLLFHSISYEIKPDGMGGGNATVLIEDIRSDAINTNELNEDKKNLFEFMYKSDEFIDQMKGEGKDIQNRNIIIEDGKLNGLINFNFDDIELVEGIIYEEPFYYLTLSREDSVISTNGEVIISDNHKRILWDNSIKVLKFKMFSDIVEKDKLIGMAQYYESE